MLAPEPYFQARGTPISVYFRLSALSELGHRVTLVTYPLGEDRVFPGLKIVRVPNVLGLRSVKIGPSLAKIPFDALLFLRAFLKLAGGGYDLIFSHEEASLFGVWLAKLFGRPHLYDMHSSLPQQLENFGFSRSPLLKSLFGRMERYVLRNSGSVIVICRDLERQVRFLGQADKAVFLENFLDFDEKPPAAAEVKKARRELAPRGDKIVLYAGNFLPYQGIPLLLEAAARVKKSAVFVLVGGSGPDLERMRDKAQSLGIADKVKFVRRVPPDRIPLFVAAADVLVSPRLAGTNTPLKIYSFLKSGKPLVATDLWTHTQVLDPRIAILVEPNPSGLARGLEAALAGGPAPARARAAKKKADREYTRASYLKKMGEALAKARARRNKEPGP
ncbi:MAG: glycosyltransferase family 4 protein [Candidatus Aminicenantes bacterium]|nr:glycosyltransferase family 4 protein [Candidatus Aminicenantes bacterium]